jgi:predicted nuclease with TOPRIM domain
MSDLINRLRHIGTPETIVGEVEDLQAALAKCRDEKNELRHVLTDSEYDRSALVREKKQLQAEVERLREMIEWCLEWMPTKPRTEMMKKLCKAERQDGEG